MSLISFSFPFSCMCKRDGYQPVPALQFHLLLTPVHLSTNHPKHHMSKVLAPVSSDKSLAAECLGNNNHFAAVSQAVSYLGYSTSQRF